MNIKTLFVLAITVPIAYCLRNWRKIVVYYAEMKPLSIVTLEGRSIKCYCGSSTPVYWTYGQSKLLLPGRHFLENTTLILNNLSRFDTGLYGCKGSYLNDSETVPFEKHIIVTVINYVPNGYLL